MDCPDDDTLALLLGGEAVDESRLHAHVDACPQCAALLVELAALYHQADDEPDDEPENLRPGTTIAGRYRMERVLGQGGMGVVYLAHDEQLRREVAIKLVRPEVAAEHGPQLQARLHREARAMARINDPAVVRVLDVGGWRSTVYVVMERVDGVTLRTWLRAQPRTRAQVVEALATAGRGLLAAHRAGVVHRDFKPDNVLVGSDGRARVTDFGMAILPNMDPHTPRSMEAVAGSTWSSAPLSTQTGTVMGTPAYMAPEQLDGRPLDARSDQYAWCLVLAEAVGGHRPFEGRTPYELRQAQRTVPSLDGLPPEIRAVVQRGLCERADQRWRDLGEALRVLRAPSRNRWRWGAMALLAVGGWGLLPSGATSASPSASRCEAEVTALQSSWTRAQADRGAVQAEPRARRVDQELQRYVTALTTGYRRACDTKALPPSVASDQALDCLDRRRARLAPILERWATDAGHDLFDVVADLQAPRSCFGNDQQRPLPRDPARAAQTGELRTALETGWGHLALGDIDEAEQRLQALHGDIEELGFEPLLAEWNLMSGRLLTRRGSYEPARQRLETAYWQAHRRGDDWIAGRSATALFRLLGDTLSRFEDAELWARHAESSLRRADRAASWYHFHASRAAVAIRREHARLAREHARQAMVLARRLWPPGHGERIASRVNLAVVDNMQGDFATARQRLVRSVQESDRERGVDHPDLIVILQSLAQAVSRQGHDDQAEQHLARALRIAHEVHGPDHPEASDIRNGLAILAAIRGDHDRAQRLFSEELELVEASLGPDSERAMRVRTNLGHVRIKQGDLDGALDELMRVVAWEQEVYGPDAVGLVTKLILLGEVEQARGQPGPAVTHLDRALALLDANEGADTDLMASALEHRAAVRRGQGQFEPARVDLQRALSMRRDDNSRAPCLIELGHLARAMDRPQQAAVHYRDALALPGLRGPQADEAQAGLAMLAAPG